MARWLVDSDVLIDIALVREPHADSSRRVVDLLQQEGHELFIAWHTASNAFYNVRRQANTAVARTFITSLLGFAQVATTGTDSLRDALSLPMADFEDAMQVAAAQACDAQFIVTRNERDFTRSPIPALTPADALAELSR